MSFLRRHGRRIALLFIAVLLPLWGFGELAEDVGAHQVFFFDQPILEWLHAHRSVALDRCALLFSLLGFRGGVIPADVFLIAGLLVLRRRRDALFAAVAIGGSVLLNVVAKHHYGRLRPSLWESLAPETTFSFPSGHAMGSMTLAVVLVLLAWNTRWRWTVVVASAAFVLVVGWSRLYLGVHYPSDVLGGWGAALAWVIGVYPLVYGFGAAQRLGR